MYHFIADIQLVGATVSIYETYYKLTLGSPKVFLTPYEITSPGVLLGFVAYFMTSDLVFLQIWRPVPGQTNVFSLVYQYPSNSSMAYSAPSNQLQSRAVVSCDWLVIM